MISTELTRIIDAKGTIEQALWLQGGSVGEGLITDYAEAVMAIKPIYPSNYPMTFECVKEDNGEAYIYLTNINISGHTFYYCKNESDTWNVLNFNTNIPMKYGDRISVKSTDASYMCNASGKYQFGGKGIFNCYGSALSLINNRTTLTGRGFMEMFNPQLHLLTSPNFPDTALCSYCYRGLFYGMTSIIVGPELLFTGQVPNNGYAYMFDNSSNLRYVKVMAGSKIDNTSCKNMLNNTGTASSLGTLYLKNGVTTTTLGITLPSGWTTASDYY